MSISWLIDNTMDRGSEYEAKEQYTAAYATYKEGLRKIGNLLDGNVEKPVLSYLSSIYEHYKKKNDKIQEEIARRKESGRFHEQYEIKNNSLGNSYKSLFGRFLDDQVQFLIIHDPNIDEEEECQNFVRLCELLTQSCLGLKYIEVITTNRFSLREDQALCFERLKADLLKRNVKLFIKYSETLSEMKITLSTGWIIKSSRGINIYKEFPNIFAFGQFDLELRPCERTTIDIYFTTTIKTSRRLEDV